MMPRFSWPMMWSPPAPKPSSPSGRARRGRSPLRSLPQMPHASTFRMAASSGMSSGTWNSRTSNSPGPTLTDAKLVSGTGGLLFAHHQFWLHRLEPGRVLWQHCLVCPEAVVRGPEPGGIAALLHSLDRIEELAARLNDREVGRA